MVAARTITWLAGSHADRLSDCRGVDDPVTVGPGERRGANQFRYTLGVFVPGYRLDLRHIHVALDEHDGPVEVQFEPLPAPGRRSS